MDLNQPIDYLNPQLKEGVPNTKLSANSERRSVVPGAAPILIPDDQILEMGSINHSLSTSLRSREQSVVQVSTRGGRDLSYR